MLYPVQLKGLWPGSLRMESAAVTASSSKKVHSERIAYLVDSVRQALSCEAASRNWR